MRTSRAELPTTELDPARAERIRTRCRAELARRASRASAPHVKAAQVWQPLIAVLAAAYLTKAIVQTLRVYGLP